MLEQIQQASETEMYVITLKLYSSVSTLSVVNVVSACRDLRTVTDTITCEQTLVHTVVAVSPPSQPPARSSSVAIFRSSSARQTRSTCNTSKNKTCFCQLRSGLINSECEK